MLGTIHNEGTSGYCWPQPYGEDQTVSLGYCFFTSFPHSPLPLTTGWCLGNIVLHFSDTYKRETKFRAFNSAQLRISPLTNDLMGTSGQH